LFPIPIRANIIKIIGINPKWEDVSFLLIVTTSYTRSSGRMHWRAWHRGVWGMDGPSEVNSEKDDLGRVGKEKDENRINSRLFNVRSN